MGTRCAAACIQCLSVLVLVWFVAASTRTLVAAGWQDPGAAAHENTNRVRGWIRGRHVRIQSPLSPAGVVLQGEWKPHDAAEGAYHYQLVSMKSVRLLTEESLLWGARREVRVLSALESMELFDGVLETLTPAGRGRGLYFQTALGDGVVYRDAAGRLVGVHFEDCPADVVLERRYGIAEFADVLAVRVRGELSARHPGESRFLFAMPEQAGSVRFLVLDLENQYVIALSLPGTGEDPRGGPRIGRFAGFAALLFQSHGMAFLKNPVSSVGRMINQTSQVGLSFIRPLLRLPSGAPGPLHPGPDMDLEAWEAWLDGHTSTVREPGRVKFHINGEQFFPAFEAAVRAARHHVRIQICIFDRDDVAVGVADLLRERSRDVEVRVIYDQMTSLASGMSPPRSPMTEGFVAPRSIHSRLLQDGKVAVRPFLNPFFVVNHQKVLLIDGDRAFMGGMNFGREYRYEWHDLMAEVEGPVVQGFEQDFARAWAHEGPFGDLAYLGQVLVPAVKPCARWTPGSTEGAPLRRLYTRTAIHQVRAAVLESIRRARNRIYLENPYLYDNAVIRALSDARARGVDVRVVMPTENDLVGGRSSNRVTANYLFQRGVRVYQYPGMTHVKALLVDGWVCFGSANFNRLSLRTNQEANLATSDPDIVGRLRRDLFEVDFTKSRELRAPLAVEWTDHVTDGILGQF